jgi:hypothetical protein
MPLSREGTPTTVVLGLVSCYNFVEIELCLTFEQTCDLMSTDVAPKHILDHSIWRACVWWHRMFHQKFLDGIELVIPHSKLGVAVGKTSP